MAPSLTLLVSGRVGREATGTAPRPRCCLPPAAHQEPSGPHEADLVVCDQTIENWLHWVKDAVLGEDASLIHTGQGPRVMSLLRDLALNLLRLADLVHI